MGEIVLILASLLVAVIGYVIGHSEGYSEGRRDGWLQYDSIVADIQDEAEQLRGR